MSLAPHLTLISEVLPVNRRDFPIATPALLNPYNANPLYDGEWLGFNASYQLDRLLLGIGAGEVAVPTFQLFAERGRYDTQAIGKVPVLFGGFYEAETDIANLAGLAEGEPLMVADVTVDTVGKKGLVHAAGAGRHLVVGWVTRLPGSGKVRYWHNGFTYMTI